MSGDESYSGVMEALEELSERKGKERAQAKQKYDYSKRQHVHQKSGSKCVKCRARKSDGKFLEVDHITERSAGGGNETENLRSLCIKCHTDRHDQTLENGLDFPDYNGGRLKRLWRNTASFEFTVPRGRGSLVIPASTRLYPASRIYALTNRINYSQDVDTMMEVYDALVKYDCLDGRDSRGWIRATLITIIEMKELLSRTTQEFVGHRSAPKIVFWRRGASRDYGWEGFVRNRMTAARFYFELVDADGEWMRASDFITGSTINRGERLDKLVNVLPEIKKRQGKYHPEWRFDSSELPDQILDGVERDE